MKSLPTILDTQNGWSIIDGRVSNVPADNSSITSFGSSYPHVRSMPMNTWMGPIAPYAGITTVVFYYKESSLINPGSANAWIFIDENPISINDGSFICDPQIQDWIDCPASYHNNTGGVAFADGHAQIRKWTDPTVLHGWAPPTIQPGNPSFTRPPPGNPPTDLTWLGAVGYGEYRPSLTMRLPKDEPGKCYAKDIRIHLNIIMSLQILNIMKLAEGVGFEPTVALRLLLISSQMPLTTQPPFQSLVFTGVCSHTLAAGSILEIGRA